MMMSKIKKWITYFSNLRLLPVFYDAYINDLKSNKVLMGQILANQNLAKEIKSINDAEFCVFSQWGDDGIIQYLIAKIDFPNKTFIEFGVENYRESNTRFLMINNKWQGMVIDGSAKHADYIRKDVISWAHHLLVLNAFITKENINELLASFLKKGYDREIGILSIDIDGNDYWVWKEIEVVNPILVIVEYNAVFGPDKAWTIPYDEKFNRFERLPRGYLYYGASVGALKTLAKQKGYVFIGCNSNGNNAYFLRHDKIKGVEYLEKNATFCSSSFQELWLAGKHEEFFGSKRLDFIKGEKVFDVSLNSLTEIQ